MSVEFIADLHLHSCLSPCAELSMSPKGIVERAASLGINIIAVCDHNSAENVEATERLAHSKGIRLFPGMEITSAEEVHLLGLFRDTASVIKMQETVYARLQQGEHDEEAFGMQVVANEEDEVLGFNNRLLIGATDMPVQEIVERIHEIGGLAIASHIDREGFGIIGQLGFIPPDLRFDALEISRRLAPEQAQEQFSHYSKVPWISSSDAHTVDDIGKRTIRLVMEHATFDEFRLALRGEDGRRVIF